jgi:hypothetical protein
VGKVYTEVPGIHSLDPRIHGISGLSLASLFNYKLGTCPCDATEHKLRPSNGLRALMTDDVSTIVTAKFVIKHRYRTI